MARYDGLDVPSLVRRAVDRSRDDPEVLACLPEVGRLLRLLAAQSGGRIAELGTGWAVGAAWLAAGLPPGGTLVTVEIDPARAAAARDLFAGQQAVTVIEGDWRLAAERAPYDLVFSDGGSPKRNPGDPELLAPLLRHGGLAVFDDYTPGRAIGGDVSRQIWLDNPDWLAIELQVAADAAVILATPTASPA